MASKAAGLTKREREARRLCVALADLCADTLERRRHAAKTALGADWKERIEEMRRSAVAKGRRA